MTTWDDFEVNRPDNESKAGLKRYAKSVKTPAYAAMVRIMRDGRHIAQPDLFA